MEDLERKFPPSADRLLQLFEESQSPVKRHTYLQELSERGITAVVPLCKLFQSVPISAIEKLKNMDAWVIDPLICALEHEDKLVREGAARALAEIWDARSVAPLHKALRDEEERVRESAAEALMRMKHEVERLIGLYKESVQASRNEYLRQLVRIGIAEIVPFCRFISTLQYDSIMGLKGLGPEAVEPLISALNNDDKSVREGAAIALGEIGDARAVQPLYVALTNAASGIQGRAADALEKIGSPAVDSLLLALTCDEINGRNLSGKAIASRKSRANRAYVRCLSCRALDGIRDARAVEPLCEALRDEDDTVRSTAARALWRFHDARAVEPLCNALEDHDRQVRRYAAYALGEIADGRAVDALALCLRDKDNIVRYVAAVALAMVDHRRRYNYDPRAIKCLAEYGTDSFDVLYEAFQQDCSDDEADGDWFLYNDWQKMKALGHTKDARAIELLVTALQEYKNDNDPTYFETCVEALGNIRDARAIAPLWQTLKDFGGAGPRGSERTDAIMDALVKIGTPAVDTLIDGLRDTSHDMREQVAIALGSIGDARAMHPLCQALNIEDDEDEYDAAQQSVAEALAKIGKPAVGPLCDLLMSGGENTRCSAAHALGEIRDANALETLCRALKDQSDDVRVAAARALGRIGDADAVPALREVLVDDDEEVRNCARIALKFLNHTEGTPL